ncbi:MAG: response regulator transcription factor [Opitutaceae bacterium]
MNDNDIEVRLEEQLTVVIVEDHVLFRDFLQKTCSQVFGLKVLGTVGMGSDCLELCKRSQPHLLLLDLQLPDVNGIDLLEDIKKASNRTKILAVSSMVDEWTQSKIVDSSLDGFVDKTESDQDCLREAITSVMRGEKFFSPVVGRVRAQLFKNPHAFIKILSDREVEVIRLIGQGLSDDEASIILELSAATVKAHRRNIMLKLGIHTTRDLMRFAIHSGLSRL